MSCSVKFCFTQIADLIVIDLNTYKTMAVVNAVLKNIRYIKIGTRYLWCDKMLTYR